MSYNFFTVYTKPDSVAVETRSSHKDQSGRAGPGVHDPLLEGPVTRKLGLDTNRAMFNRQANNSCQCLSHLYSKGSCTWSAPRTNGLAGHTSHKSSTTPWLCRMKPCEQMLRKLMATSSHASLCASPLARRQHESETSKSQHVFGVATLGKHVACQGSSLLASLQTR